MVLGVSSPPPPQDAPPVPVNPVRALAARLSAEEDPWYQWATRPRGPRQRYEDVMLQIRRDLAVLKEPKEYHPDDSFYEKRIVAFRVEALELAKELGL